MTDIHITENETLLLIINFIGLNNAIISAMIGMVAPSALSMLSEAVPTIDLALVIGFGITMTVFGINLFIVIMLDAVYLYRKYLSKYHLVVEKE